MEGLENIARAIFVEIGNRVGERNEVVGPFAQELHEIALMIKNLAPACLDLFHRRALRLEGKSFFILDEPEKEHLEKIILAHEGRREESSKLFVEKLRRTARFRAPSFGTRKVALIQKFVENVLVGDESEEISENE